MPRSLRLADFSDRELLALIVDLADSDLGGVSTAALAEVIRPDVKYPLTSVGIRLGYLKRLGLLTRDTVTRQWHLTMVGYQFTRGRLTAAQNRAIGALDDPGAAWVATEALSALLADAGPEQATLMRRQWTHGWAQRNGR